LAGVYQKAVTEILEEFVKIYYSQQNIDLPEIVLLQTEIDDSGTVKDWLSELKGKVVNITFPKIGEKSRMIFLAEKNARLLLNDMKLEKLKKDYTPRSLESLKRDLRLPKLPAIIECFDISHFAGRFVLKMLNLLNPDIENLKFRL